MQIIEEKPPRDKHVSVNYTDIFFGIKLYIDNGITTEVYILCYFRDKYINSVLTGNIEKKNYLSIYFAKSATIFHLDIQWMI